MFFKGAHRRPRTHGRGHILCLCFRRRSRQPLAWIANDIRRDAIRRSPLLAISSAGRTIQVMKKLRMLACAADAGIEFSSIGYAQTNTPRVDRREQNQQNRVAGGLKDGSITSREAAKIERDEAKIQRDEARAKADGVVTTRERARLNRELNHTSREIHRDRKNNPGLE